MFRKHRRYTILFARERKVSPGVNIPKLILIHSRGEGSTPALKALISRIWASPPTRQNAVLDKAIRELEERKKTNPTEGLNPLHHRER